MDSNDASRSAGGGAVGGPQNHRAYGRSSHGTTAPSTWTRRRPGAPSWSWHGAQAQDYVGRRYLTPAILTFNEALPEADLAEATAA